MNYNPTGSFYVKPAFFISRLFKSSFIIALLVTFGLAANCQDMMKKSDTTKKSLWWIGLAGGVNYNRYDGSTSHLNNDVNLATPYDKGHGFGAYGGALIEFHPRNSNFAFSLQQGFDGRRGVFEENDNRLEAQISYATVEPALMYSPRKSRVFIYAGPRFGFLLSSEFTFQVGNNPEYPEENRHPDAYIKNLDKISFSAHVGVGYNFIVSRKEEKRQTILAPFITYLPSLDENLRTIETLELNTIRAGIILKTGLNPQKK